MVLVSRHLGDTRSGKKIRLYYQQDVELFKRITKDFSPKDHFDAVALFEFLNLDAYRKASDSPLEYSSVNAMISFHQSQLTQRFFEEENERLGIITSIDFCNYGKSRLRTLLKK